MNTRIPVKSGAATADRTRGIFAAAKAKYGQHGVVSSSYLRVENTLTNSVSNYLFDIKKNNGNDSITESKLDRNDRFMITDLFFYLTKVDSTTQGSELLQTYPNQQVFAAVTGPPAFTPSHLGVIYNGSWSMKVGQTVNIEKIPMSHFLVAPQTQQSSATNYSQFDVKAHSWKPGEVLDISGDQDIQINVTIPTFSGIAIAHVTANITNKLVLMAYGFLCKNASYVRNK
jgi:hypothetical protein